jgi:hypothetical protein
MRILARAAVPSFTTVQRDQTDSGSLNHTRANMIAVGFGFDERAVE